MKIPVKQKIRTAALLPPEACLAKTCRGARGCDAATHLRVCALAVRALRGAFAGTLREEFLSEAAEYLAALHDIGKITPGFQQKIHAAIGETLALVPRDEHVDHAEFSGWILRQRFGEQFASLAAAHHGLDHDLGNPDRNNDFAEQCGGAEWSRLRWQIADGVLEALALDPARIPTVDPESAAAVCGAVVMADWLSSGIELAWGEDADADEVAGRVRNAGFVSPRIRKGLSFEEIFGFPPNALQTLCHHRCVPGEINVIESEMGSGKTEAALYMAYQMLESGGANGIYFALPTRLTSAKIHARLNDFLGKILEDDRREALLIHGDAWLDRELSVPPPNDFQSSRNPDAWFQSRKRALLAPFGAGTVDQALLAVLNARHYMVRSFGLSGKVVIVDECHSYDSYTGSLVKKLIRHLRALRCTVIVLSATLTDRARREFALPAPAPLPAPESPRPYPLVSRSFPDGREEQHPFQGAAPRQVALTLTPDEGEAVRTAWAKAEAGEQVLWIENTVQKAQKVFRQLSLAPNGCETGLIHSRFPGCVRSRNENHWVELLGKKGGEARGQCGRILVGTQVLEQSVDIDADFLITRIAPIDMLLQRMGRLWRHERRRPEGASRAVLLLTEPILEEPEKISSGAFLPYEDYPICRTYEVLKDRRHLELPGEIRPLLEAIYRERDETGPLAGLKAKMTAKIAELTRQARKATGHAQNPVNDDKAKTRINEQPSVQLLLLRKNNGGLPPGTALSSPFAPNPILLPPPRETAEKIAAAKAVMRLLITVPEKDAPSYDSFPLDFLAPFLYIGDDDFRPVRAAFLDDDGSLLDRSSRRLPGAYHPDLGFIADEK